jgi:two-component system, cell cycle sensor histidine kinase and response regulator CckA
LRGHVAVYSELGRGTAFKVYLPEVRDSVAAPRPAAEPVALPAGRETILLAEDEPTVRALAGHILGSCGYRVLEAPDGKGALAVAAAHAGPIHLLISDVVMPQLGGRELAERFAALRPDVPVLFLSGYTDDAVIRHGVLEAEFAFLQKPFTPSALARKVRAVLDRPAGGSAVLVGP